MGKIHTEMYKLGSFLLLFVSYCILIPSVLFLLNIPINAIELVIAWILAGISMVLIFRGQRKRLLLVMAIGTGLIVAAIVFSGRIYDIAWDGNAYHKVAVGFLKNGWNPVYQSANDFAVSSENAIFHNIKIEPWVESFPTASWVFGALVYSCTGNIETGKAINVLMLIIVFSFAYSLFSQYQVERGTGNEKKRSAIWSVVFATVWTLNPIAINQVFTFYVDGLLGSIVSLIVLLQLAILCLKPQPGEKGQWFIWLAMAIVIGTNLKFSGLGIVAVFCFVFYLISWIVALGGTKKGTEKRKKEWERVKKLTLYYVAVVAVAIGIVGAPSYMRNLVVYGHPAYPIMGKNAYIKQEDLTEGYLPPELTAKGNYEKWVRVTFSRTQGGVLGETPVEWKAPFTFSADELTINLVDTQRAGFGFAFSGLLVVAVGVLACAVIKWRRRYPIAALCLLGILLASGALIGILEASWLARYTSFLYILLPLAAGVLALADGKVCRLVAAAFCLIIILNTTTFFHFYITQYKEGVAIEAAIDTMKKEPMVEVNALFPATVFLLEDNEVNYRLVEELPDPDGSIGYWLLRANYKVVDE